MEKGHRVMLNAVSKPEEIKTASLKQLYEDAAEVQEQIVYELPLNHSFGMRVLRSTLFLGATVVLQNGFTFAKEIETNIEQHH